VVNNEVLRKLPPDLRSSQSPALPQRSSKSPVYLQENSPPSGIIQQQSDPQIQSSASASVPVNVEQDS